MALSSKEIAAVASAAGFTGRDLTIAVAVAFAESGGNPDAVNHNTDTHRSVDYGLWQINGYWNPEILRMGSWSNPADNARMAYAVFKQQGWRAWSTYKSGSYLAFMGKAVAANPGKGPATVPIPDAVPVANTGNLAPDGADFGGRVKRVGAAILGVALVVFALDAMTGGNVMKNAKLGAELAAVV